MEFGEYTRSRILAGHQKNQEERAADARRKEVSSELQRASRPYFLLEKMLQQKGHLPNVKINQRVSASAEGKIIVQERFQLKPVSMYMEGSEREANVELGIITSHFPNDTIRPFDPMQLNLIVNIPEEPEIELYMIHIEKPTVRTGGRVTKMYGMRLHTEHSGRYGELPRETDVPELLAMIEEAAELAGVQLP